jgi:hypothetical protein
MRWMPGLVNREREHFQLTVGHPTVLTALVGWGVNGYVVQFVDGLAPTILDAVRRELNFYLVELKEADPWPMPNITRRRRATFIAKFSGAITLTETRDRPRRRRAHRKPPRGAKSPFNPSSVVQEYAALLKSYQC